MIKLMVIAVILGNVFFFSFLFWFLLYASTRFIVWCHLLVAHVFVRDWCRKNYWFLSKRDSHRRRHFHWLFILSLLATSTPRVFFYFFYFFFIRQSFYSHICQRAAPSLRFTFVTVHCHEKKIRRNVKTAKSIKNYNLPFFFFFLSLGLVLLLPRMDWV